MIESKLTERLELLEGFIEQLQHTATWKEIVANTHGVMSLDKETQEDLAVAIAEYVYLNRP
jgi:uncharacterized protein YecA (UPF0149 family)